MVRGAYILLWLLLLVSFGVQAEEILKEHKIFGTSEQDRLQALKDARVTLNLKNATMADFFSAIQAQTKFYFVYNTQDLTRLEPVTMSVKEQSLKELLDTYFVSNYITYDYSREGVIVLKAVDQGGKLTLLSGSVLDKTNTPIPFATVAVKGSTLGTSTNDAGQWQLFVNKNESPILVFSCVGMESTEYKVHPNEPNFITVTLRTGNVTMDEVVVTGYERIDKRKMTGSVASVKGSDVMEPVGTSIDKMLQGKLAGVQVLQNTSTPGAAPKIRIRGNSTIMGNREPVWVVDGIIMEDPVKITAAELNSMDRINLIGNAISFLNPEDIDRIDVLKDVSATAIYGVKAANGVVVITTKRGKTGKASVGYSLSMSLKTRPSYRTANLMNSNERIDVSEEIARRGLLYSGGGISKPKVAYEGLLQELWNKEINYDQFVSGVNELRAMNTDWFDELMRNSFSQVHNLSVSGGSDKARYYFSASVVDDKDVQKNTGLLRYTVNMNTDVNLLENLKLSVGLNASTSTIDRTHPSVDLMGYAYQTARTIKAREPNGKPYYYPAAVFDPGDGTVGYIGYNIFNEMAHSGEEEKATAINLNVNLDYKIMDWLTFNGLFGYSSNDVKMEGYADDQSYYISEQRGVPYGTPIPDDPAFKNTMDIPYGGELTQNVMTQNTYNLRPTVSLQKVFGDHYLDVQAGMELRSSKYSSSRSVRWGYLPDRGKQFVEVNLDEYRTYREKVQKNFPSLQDNLTNTVSWFGVLRYSFTDRYIANFNIRYDGSNRFGRDKSNRFLPVWSVAGRWNLHNESFMKDVEFLNTLGLKASYGAQGNVVDDQTPNMVINRGNFYANSQQYSSTLYSFPNPNLRWEKTISWQAGIEFSLFDNFVSGSFEYYDKTGKDQVVTKKLPQTGGAESVVMNGGTLKNNGWELGLTFGLIRKRDWNWDLTFNVSQNKNRVENTVEPGNTYQSYLDGSIVLNGQTLNSFYSYRYAGLDNKGLPTFDGLDFYDENGQLISPTLEDAIRRALVISGQRDPKVSGGFTTGIKYKQLSLSMNFAYAMGNKVRLNNLYKEDGQQLPMPEQNWSKDFVKRWQNPGDEKFTDIPVLSDENLMLSNENQKYIVGNNKWQMYNKSDLRVVSGDYLRCTSMSLTYRFGEQVYRKIYAKGLSCSLGCNNVFLIADKALNGQDPEQVGFGSRTTPPQRTWSFTFDVNF